MRTRKHELHSARFAEARPAPDEAPLEDARPARPERHEPTLADPGPRHLSFREWTAVVWRSVKKLRNDNMKMIAQALAYSSFLAIPSVLLVVIGLFTLLASPSTITLVIDHLGRVMPGAAKTLVGQSLHRLDQRQGASLTMAIVGFVLALWSTTGAMTGFMTALNLAYDREDRRSFLKKRLTALMMVACIGAAFMLVAFFLLFGPQIEKHLGSALGIGHVLSYVWWSAQWPILILGLLAAFATLLYLGPDTDHPRWRFLTLGTCVAVIVWLAISGAFAFYTAHFGSYNKTWGSLAAVIIMMVWLWLSSLALLFGAEINAEAERSRGLERRP